jgi:hypothetical protein
MVCFVLWWRLSDGCMLIHVAIRNGYTATCSSHHLKSGTWINTLFSPMQNKAKATDDLIKILSIELASSLTHSHSLMELSPSWEAADCAATQELPSVLWNPKIRYGVHKSPPLVPILSKVDPIPTIPAYLSKIHFNVVHPPTSWSSPKLLPWKEILKWLSWTRN